jgi:very-short-patch-repair endonuclease
MPTQEAQSCVIGKQTISFASSFGSSSALWANRRVMTPSELRLWSALKARQLGVQFRREVPLAGHYIVDFCAPRARLVVEVDGACHGWRPQADARRDAELRGLGYRVLRVAAELVLRDLPAVVALVRSAL